MGVEVVLGFAVGYWVGTRQGRKGLQQAMDSAQAIWASPETRKLLSEGLTVLEAAAGPAMNRLGGKSNGTRAALIGSVVDELIERRQARRAA
jgi:hypothetical protein